MYRIIAEVQGMACSMCEAHINDAVRAAFPVKKVASSHKNRLVEILTEQPIGEDALRSVIGATGYTFVSMRTEPYEKKGFSLFGKK